MKIANVFNSAKLYGAFQFAVAKKNTHNVIKDEIIRPDEVSVVLDFGCGIGYHSKMFPSAMYLGIEPIKSCVKLANKHYSNPNAEFRAGDHALLTDLESESFDLVIAIGVLHHIDDSILRIFAKESKRILRPGGRLTTFDPVLHIEQSKVSRWVVKRDRGAWVRTEQDYVSKIQEVFSEKIETRIYSKLLRIPYDHIVIDVLKN